MGVIIRFCLPALPLLAFLGFLALLIRRREEVKSGVGDGWREAFLQTAVLWTTLAFVFTEVLSLRSLLSSVCLSICWGLACLAVLVFLEPKDILNLTKCFAPFSRELSTAEKALQAWIVISLATTALVAFVSPPNNWDSMTYHMSRVAHWWANGTIDFYPTNIVRQLYMGPLAEYIVLQFFALSGGSDRLANLVQWFCFGGCAVAMSLIGKRLGADRFTQLMVAFVVLTTPIAILEATSTQNDVVCAFFTVSTLYFLFADRTVLTGLSFGLALLTKSPAGFLILPFLVLVFIRGAIGRRALLKTTAQLLAIGSLAFALNVPHWLRNRQILENPLGYTPDVSMVESQDSRSGSIRGEFNEAFFQRI